MKSDISVCQNISMPLTNNTMTAVTESSKLNLPGLLKYLFVSALNVHRNAPILLGLSANTFNQISVEEIRNIYKNYHVSSDHLKIQTSSSKSKLFIKNKSLL